MHLPAQVQYVLKQINNHGYDCFLVGGCVRDHLLKRDVHDYDFTTDATPDQIIACFQDTPCQIILTGIKHGTVAILYDDMLMEITTYRIEQEYENHRKPKKVIFCDDLIADLGRRDFTINAIAYHPDHGYIDPFDGQADLKRRIIRCVGISEQRFEEDALRILRALRFSFQLRFTLTKECESAMQRLAPLLKHIAKERIREEFNAMLMSDANNLLSRLRDVGVLPYILPSMQEIYDTKQENQWHRYDVFTHTDIALNHTDGMSLSEKLAVVLHDIGKAQAKTYDEAGHAHFYGHPEISTRLAEQALRELRYGKAIIQEVVTLISYHDYPLTPTPKAMRRFLAKLDMDDTLAMRIMRIQEADDLAKNPENAKAKLERVRACQKLLPEMTENDALPHRLDLQVNGYDLMALGYQGKEIGDALTYLYHLVVEDPSRNEKSYLLEILKHKEQVDYQKH